MNRIAIAVAALTTALTMTGLAARAMPPFAQAYGVSCSTCHTQVPALNAYGRYVQRTGYASLDPKVLNRAFPIWVGWNTSYDSQDPDKPHQTLFGNVAIHAAGPIDGDWSYHVHQWIWENDTPGGVDTLWLAYNKLFHRDGHLFVGKIEAPGPSVFSQWFDLAAFTTPQITVGEHTYENDGNRWGTKFGYAHGNLTAEAGYLYSDQDLGGVSEFGSATDKTFQWKAAYAPPDKPLEAGFYGTRGSWPLEEGGTDQYSSVAGYFERDPTRGVPGILVMYQISHDANPGPDLGPAGSNAGTFELYQPIFRDGMLSVRKEFTNDGLGTRLETGNIDFSYRIAKYLRLYTEAAMAQNNTPAWRYEIWWTTPLTRSLLPEH